MKNKTLKFIMAIILMLIIIMIPPKTTQSSIFMVVTNKMYAKYQEFSGEKDTIIEIKENKELIIKASVITEDGEINISIIENNNEENIIYEEKNIQTSEFTIPISIEENTSYKLKIEAEKHKGSYDFGW